MWDACDKGWKMRETFKKSTKGKERKDRGLFGGFKVSTGTRPISGKVGKMIWDLKVKYSCGHTGPVIPYYDKRHICPKCKAKKNWVKSYNIRKAKKLMSGK